MQTCLRTKIYMYQTRYCIVVFKKQDPAKYLQLFLGVAKMKRQRILKIIKYQYKKC